MGKHFLMMVPVMDELDAVFDQWEKQKDLGGKKPSQSVLGEDESIAELKTAMAASQLDAIPSLMATFGELAAPDWVAAVEGCLESAAGSIRDLEMLRQIDCVRQAIRTKKGSLRQKLSKKLRAHLAHHVPALCLVSEAEEDEDVLLLLRSLEGTQGLNSSDIQDLFASGIHRAQQLINGDELDLATATGLELEKVRALKGSLKPVQADVSSESKNSEDS